MPHCEAHVKKALEALDGVETATASHEAGTAVVTLSGAVEDDVLNRQYRKPDNGNRNSIICSFHVPPDFAGF